MPSDHKNFPLPPRSHCPISLLSTHPPGPQTSRVSLGSLSHIRLGSSDWGVARDRSYGTWGARMQSWCSSPSCPLPHSGAHPPSPPFLLCPVCAWRLAAPPLLPRLCHLASTADSLGSFGPCPPSPASPTQCLSPSCLLGAAGYCESVSQLCKAHSLGPGTRLTGAVSEGEPVTRRRPGATVAGLGQCASPRI